jgi:DNA-binding CsgD family transcriptional regulator
VDADRWPLVGRDETIDTVLDLLGDATVDGVVLVGAPGVGSTRVLDELHDRLRRSGRDVNRVVASPSTVDLPFGALASVIPGPVTGSDGTPVGLLDVFERIRGLMGGRRRPHHRFVTCVDDLRWLDDRSTALLTQLVAAGLAQVVGTLHHDDPIGDAVSTLERSTSIRRIVVDALPDDDVARLVRAAFDDPIDGGAVRRVVEIAQGHPLVIADLLEGSIAAGTLVRRLGVWTFDGVATLSGRLSARADALLADLDPPARSLLDVLAIGGPVTVDALDRCGLLAAAVDLESRGLVASDDAAPSRVRVASAIAAAHLGHGLSPLRRRLVLPRVVELVEADRDAADLVRTTSWRLDARLPVDADDLARAASAARGSGDFVATERLAAAAAEHDPTIDRLVLHAEALHELCRFDDAERVLDHAERLVDDDGSRLRVAVLRHRILLWGRLDPAASVAVVERAAAAITEPLLVDLAAIAVANTVVFTGAPRRVDEIVGSLRTGHPIVATGLVFARTIAATLAGRGDDAREIASAGVAARRELPHPAPIGDPALWDLGLAVALVEHGGFHEADRILAGADERIVAGAQPQLHAWLVLQRGRAALFAGRLAEATRWFAEARAVAERAHLVAALRMAATGAAMCAAQLGDAPLATDHARVLGGLPADHGYLWPERHLGFAWAVAAAGRRDEAVAAVLAGADEAAARGEVVLEFGLIVEAARLGAATTVLARVEDLATRIDGPFAAARATLVAGLARDDAAALARAEKGFANLDALLHAAESAASLARTLAARGRTRDARGAFARSMQYRTEVGDAITPLLEFDTTEVGLSPREREVAELATSGLASKAIASRLGLSVRTVSNHLQNAYAKLGVSSRDDLADALRSETRRRSG